MSAISAASSTVVQVNVPKKYTVNLIEVDETELSPPPRPPVEISISSGSAGDRTATDRMNSLLYRVQEQNEKAFGLSRVAWNELANYIGQERADDIKKVTAANLFGTPNGIGRQLDASGITVSRPNPSSASPYTDVPGYISVGDFSFRGSGSLYKVTASADGSFIGTKDDLPWRNWAAASERLPIPNAAVALGLLSSLVDPNTKGSQLKVDA